jgi:hypothetical protein
VDSKHQYPVLGDNSKGTTADTCKAAQCLKRPSEHQVNYYRLSYAGQYRFTTRLNFPRRVTIIILMHQPL